MEKLRTDGDAVRDAIGRTVVSNLKRMARMGVFLERNVRELYPGISDGRRRAQLGRISAAAQPGAGEAGREARQPRASGERRLKRGAERTEP